MSGPKPHKVIVYATCETVVSHDDPAEAGMIARKLFEDDISSKSEMFTVRVQRVQVEGLKHKSYYWVKLDERGFWQPARWVKPLDVGHWELIGEDYWRDAGDVHEVGAEITYDELV